MVTYPAILRKDEGSDSGVNFPDLPGCVTAGRNLDEARRNAAEALAFHLEGLIGEGEAIPDPSSLEEVLADRENVDGVPFLVEAPDPRRVVRVNITLPEDVLERIDAFCHEKGATRSAFLVEAALHAIDSDRLRVSSGEQAETAVGAASQKKRKEPTGPQRGR